MNKQEKLDIYFHKHKQNREQEYPSWQDQLDYIFHNGVEKWKEDVVQPIKDRHPNLSTDAEGNYIGPTKETWTDEDGEEHIGFRDD